MMLHNVIPVSFGAPISEFNAEIVAQAHQCDITEFYVVCISLYLGHYHAGSVTASISLAILEYTM